MAKKKTAMVMGGFGRAPAMNITVKAPAAPVAKKTKGHRTGIGSVLGFRKALVVAERGRARMENKAGRAEERVDEVIRMGLTLSSSFAFSYVSGRYNGAELVKGVPLDFFMGTTMELLGFLGIFGGYSKHVHSLGNGALSSAVSHIGLALGMSAKSAEAWVEKMTPP